MSLPKRRWQDMTSVDFATSDVSNWIAVLPVAAIEQHGPHLPLGTDAMIGEGLIDAALDVMPNELPVTVLPMQSIGKSNEHVSSSGTLTFDWQTVIKAWIEIGESVHRAGIQKMIIINSHGGNAALIDIVAVELRVRFDMLVVATSWGKFGEPEGLFSDREKTYGIHGGDIETSLMLALRPDLVDMDKAKDFHSSQLDFLDEFSHLRAHGPVSFGWKAQDLNIEGTVGDASIATSKKGGKLIAHQASRFVALCDDVNRFDMSRLWKG